MPALAVDRNGDLAIGYTKSNATTNPQIKYAGRLAGDPVNTLPQTEQTLIDGTGSQSGNCGGSACTRWGDYSGDGARPERLHLLVHGEYYVTTGLNDQTRIGSFRSGARASARSSSRAAARRASTAEPAPRRPRHHRHLRRRRLRPCGR